MIRQFSRSTVAAILLGTALAVPFAPAALAQPCADPRGNSYCTDTSPTPSRLVCCVNPTPSPAATLTITPAAARVGDRVVVEDSALLQITAPATVFFEWEGQDGTFIDANVSSVAPGPVGQLEFVVPPGPPESGVLCARGVVFQTACTAFTILPEPTPADLNPDTSSW